jgi:uroporphyrinogen III methyltransferase / synthase
MNNALLFAKRIVITRAREQADTLAEKIRALGGTPIVFPTIAFQPLENFEALDNALRNWRAFDWVVFTSANGVRFVAERFPALGLNIRILNELRVAAIGPATMRALNKLNVRVDFVPTRFLGEQVAHELPGASSESILLLRANLASNELAHGLAARGMRVTNIDAYQTVRAESIPINSSQADAITFTSSSTVENFALLLDETTRAQLGRLVVFCIGPVTAQTARELGWNVAAIADEHTTDGLVNAMCEYYKRKERNALPRIAAPHAV